MATSPFDPRRDIWKATTDLRFAIRKVHQKSSFKGGPGFDITVRILQQKFVNDYLEVQWRDVPEVVE